MKAKTLIALLISVISLSAVAQQPQSRNDVARELQALNSTYNSSEDQYNEYNKLGRTAKHYGNNETFVCESIDYQRNHCYANTDGGIRLVRQISRGTGNSRGSCINNWGYDYYGVWVINGCRAEFATNRYEDHYGNNSSGVIRCESYKGRRQNCRTNLSNANVTLIHQLSRAPCAGNWGHTRSGIWVSNGCKADFFVTSNGQGYPGNPYNDNPNHGSNVIDCFSNNRRTQVCQVPPLAGVSISQIHSRPERSCQGNWGYSREGIWVKNGCRATFRIEPYNAYGNGYGNDYGNGYGNPGPVSELVRCKSKRYRYKACSIGPFQEVQLERVLDNSNCSQGNWGINPNGGTIWVDNGCQGEFRVFR